MTLVRYAEMAMALADAGVDVVGTSGMMDGQVGVVRTALDEVGRAATSRSSRTRRSTPRRSTARSARPSTRQLTGDRRTYQQDPANRRESMREVRLDVDEGADIVMVKPAGGYLDVAARGGRLPSTSRWPPTRCPASTRWSRRPRRTAGSTATRAILESLTSIHRAGADIVLTYWAAEVARWLREGRA